MTARDLSHSDFAGLEQSHAQRLAVAQFADLDQRVSKYEQEEEGSVLGAARWLVLCMVFVVLAAGSVVVSLS